MEKVRKHRDIELVISNYRTTKYFLENILSLEMKKAKVKTNKPVYLGLSMLEISKINVWILVCL